MPPSITLMCGSMSKLTPIKVSRGRKGGGGKMWDDYESGTLPGTLRTPDECATDIYCWLLSFRMAPCLKHRFGGFSFLQKHLANITANSLYDKRSGQSLYLSVGYIHNTDL